MEDRQEEREISKLDFVEHTRFLIQELLKFIVEEVTIEEITEISDQKDKLNFNLKTSNPGILIGRHGHTLDALEYLINTIINKGVEAMERKQITIDVENYRGKRKEIIKKYALEKADIVKKTGRKVPLGFMNSVERKLVHLALQDDPLVVTYSEGTEPYRKVVIAPREQKNNHIKIE